MPECRAKGCFDGALLVLCRLRCANLVGFYMAIGTSGNQFKNAGVAGRLMRELIEAGAFAVCRFLTCPPLLFVSLWR